ncbi:MAG: hypothetical protein OMM_03891 [Candidatus Magnetoglobus multicellularis str. Araruama]|uniref:Dystroglycan-type cadherin-like domain-containing protein n=1 Tax=Candidatus Magnetoglobus multicellularis str. Araruama TaxID=890399 RepID=A0A1V1P3Y2_9BACT|nr:MAG: hypothetical protein OMM_03891 [Candidatus Magnetoglobus multicellularis str. Araruama]
MKLIILKPDDTALKTSSFSDSDTELSDLSLPDSGTYKVIVDAQFSTLGDYALNLFRYEPISIDFGASIKGNIGLAGEKDCYTFLGNASDLISVTLDKEYVSGKRMKLIILKPDDTELKSGSFSDSDTEFSDLYLPDSGAYKIIVNGQYSTLGGYTLSITKINHPPRVFQPISAQTAIENIEYSFTFDANTFVDDDRGDNLFYTIQSLPQWLTFDENMRTFIGTPTICDIGVFSIEIFASDTSSATAFTSFKLTAVYDVNKDVNADGQLNLLDVILSLKVLAGFQDFSFNADLNRRISWKEIITVLLIESEYCHQSLSRKN